MRTLAFLASGVICFLVISLLLWLGSLPLNWYLALCFGGMILVAVVLRWKPDVLSSSIKTLEED